MIDPTRIAEFVKGWPPDRIAALQSVFAPQDARKRTSRKRRVDLLADILDREFRDRGRDPLALLLADLLEFESLVPQVYARWRPLVRDSLGFLGSRLSLERLAPKILEQLDLPPDTAPALRLFHFMSRMPGVQKLGQVLSREHQLDAGLRATLQRLENELSDANLEEIQAIVFEELGERGNLFNVELDERILAEGTVSAVIRFTYLETPGSSPAKGVFKVLKPGIQERLDEDLRLFGELALDLRTRAGSYGLGTQNFPAMVEEIRNLLTRETDFVHEQATLLKAFRIYEPMVGMRVPRLIQQFCTPRVTAMSEEEGIRVADAATESPLRRNQIVDRLVEALLAVPMFSPADPHPGNLLYNRKTNELILLDWALAETLSYDQRRQQTLLLLMLNLRDVEGACRALVALSASDSLAPLSADRVATLRERLSEQLATVPSGESIGVAAMTEIMDRLAIDGLRFPLALQMFRKATFTLNGILRELAGREVPLERTLAGSFAARRIFSWGGARFPLSLSDAAALKSSLRSTLCRAAKNYPAPAALTAWHHSFTARRQSYGQSSR
jgi:ubiquinone biosynthesis protein